MSTSKVWFRPNGTRRLMTQATVFLLTALVSLSALAQGQTITGTIKEASGTTLPGATVQIKGTTRGAQTDIDGAYSIPNVPVSSTLVFSFIGKTAQEIVIGNRAVVDATLADDSKSLQEVVVVGYGTQRRQDVTGGPSRPFRRPSFSAATSLTPSSWWPVN